MASGDASPDLALPDAAAASSVFAGQDWLSEHSYLNRAVPRAVRVASPCVGLDAPARAAAELRFPWKSLL
eukprot:685007-Alexandrium_andersonii.AAC.1